MEFTVYKKAEDVDEPASRGAKKKKVKGSKEMSPAAQTKVPPADGEVEPKQRAGRHPCDCQSVKHPLIANCLSCGKIICTQEGSGPCLFCGNLVVTREEQAVLDKKNKKSESLYKKLCGDSRSQYEAAVESKDRLLDYQANSAKRTQIIDDESDYFNVDNNRWLTPQQREALRKKKEELQQEKHKSRLDRKMTFDFAGRKVVEEQQTAEYDFQQDTKLLDLFKNDAFSVEAEIKRRSETGSDLVNPNIPRTRPVYDAVAGGLGAAVSGGLAGPVSRLQDKELQEMSDEGQCLSMHQPWASLLVLGIKGDSPSINVMNMMMISRTMKIRMRMISVDDDDDDDNDDDDVDDGDYDGD